MYTRQKRKEKKKINKRELSTLRTILDLSQKAEKGITLRTILIVHSLSRF